MSDETDVTSWCDAAFKSHNLKKVSARRNVQRELKILDS